MYKMQNSYPSFSYRLQANRRVLCPESVSLIAKSLWLSVSRGLKAAVVGVQVPRLLSPDHVECWYLSVTPRNQLNVDTFTFRGKLVRWSKSCGLSAVRSAPNIQRNFNKTKVIKAYICFNFCTLLL